MSWQLTTLGEYYDVRDGTHDSPKYVQDGYPLVTSKNLKDGKINLEKIKFISEEDFLNINKRSRVDIGDVVMAMIGTIGNPVEIIQKPKFAIKNVALFKTNKHQSPAYLKYFLSSPKTIEKMLAEAKGTTQKFVSLGYLRSFPIPVPSLQEQEKIVERLEKLNEITNYYRETKNSELANYDKLFETLLNEVFDKLTSDFPSLLLKETTYIAGRIGWKGLSKKDYKKEGPLFINVSSLNHGQYVNFENSKHISEERYFESENIGLVEGDVLICKDGSIGKVGIVGKLNELATVNSSLLIVRPLEGLLSKYLYYVFISPQFQSIVNSRIEGATVPHLYQRDIKNFSIPLPPLDIQEKTIIKLDSIYKLINDMKKNIELIKIKNENYFKSVLNNEFSYE